jgi:hypothetical protein
MSRRYGGCCEQIGIDHIDARRGVGIHRERGGKKKVVERGLAEHLLSRGKCQYTPTLTRRNQYYALSPAAATPPFGSLATRLSGPATTPSQLTGLPGRMQVCEGRSFLGSSGRSRPYVHALSLTLSSCSHRCRLNLWCLLVFRPSYTLTATASAESNLRRSEGGS